VPLGAPDRLCWLPHSRFGKTEDANICGDGCRPVDVCMEVCPRDMKPKGLLPSEFERGGLEASLNLDASWKTSWTRSSSRPFSSATERAWLIRGNFNSTVLS
jgi:hypothetical protein